MTLWFGPAWPSDEYRAPVCENDNYHMPTPVGSRCDLCAEAIVDGENGIALLYARSPDKFIYHHRECSLRNVMGCSEGLLGQAHDHSQYDIPGWYRQDARKVEQILLAHAVSET